MAGGRSCEISGIRTKVLTNARFVWKFSAHSSFREVHRTVMRKLIYGPSLWPNLYSSSQRIGILSSPVKDIGCLHEISSINLSILMLRERMMISTFWNISSRFRPGKLNINSRQARAISLWCLTPRNNVRTFNQLHYQQENAFVALSRTC